ncbi:MAG: family 43 glycosylhydrolase [Chloroflexota bacterium]
MLRPADRWAWDHWLVDDGSSYHLFFLQAPRSLGDPDLRHMNATVGHAVSTDLVDWTEVGTALRPGPAGGWDDRAIWTGSIVGHEGTWYGFYTACNDADRGLVQRIGLAVSSDLVTWTRVGEGPRMATDPRWYERLDLTAWHDEAFRDPWVFRDPEGNGWHALITARAKDGGTADSRGVVGHAWSPDLLSWEVRPPLSAPHEFGQLEVCQVVELVPGRWVLVFNVGARELSQARRERTGETRSGTYLCPAAGPLGPFDLDRARLVSELYAGRLVRRRDGSWALMGFLPNDPDGTFPGVISDPVPLAELPDAADLLG